MALCTDTVTPVWRQFGGVDDRAWIWFGDVGFARPMAALAYDSPFGERRFGKAVLRARNSIEKAGVAGEAPRSDGAGQIRISVTVISRREGPLSLAGIVGDRGLEEETAGGDHVATRDRSGSDEPFELLASAQRTVLIEFNREGRHTVRESRTRVPEGCPRETFGETIACCRTAASRHWRGPITFEDRAVAWHTRQTAGPACCWHEHGA